MKRVDFLWCYVRADALNTKVDHPFTCEADARSAAVCEYVRTQVPLRLAFGEEAGPVLGDVIALAHWANTGIRPLLE